VKRPLADFLDHGYFKGAPPAALQTMHAGVAFHAAPGITLHDASAVRLGCGARRSQAAALATSRVEWGGAS